MCDSDGDVEAFRAGNGFKIIELNGVTSEATHIYHPGTPLMTAYRVLMRQWRIAFDIGAENRRGGVAPTPLRKLAELVRGVQTHRPGASERMPRSVPPIPDLGVPGLSA